MSKAIMIQGTMSSAGKSLIVAGLCRILKQDGYRVAPFKSQNMALNSYITSEGLEMGRAQVMQAEAAGIKPSVFMNPILLKPTNDIGSQVIVNGVVLGMMNARDYFSYKRSLIPQIKAAYETLEKDYDVIIIEGAGSPAEINLKENDIVNMGMAELVDAPVLLVGDIDRGGVFAQLVGTLALLEEQERDRIKGLIINKFRGDKTILDPGISMVEERCGKKVVGVVPYMKLSLEDEDSLSERFLSKKAALIDLAVIRVPRISNFTDFDVFEQFEDVSVRYVSTVRELGNPDMILLPGSKNTMGDLKWMRENGLEAAIKKKSADTLLFGICGGYQMMGSRILDPYAVEEGGELRGMELLPVVTEFGKKKITKQVTGSFLELPGDLSALSGCTFKGYEIHMGMTRMEEQISDSCSLLTVTDGLLGRMQTDGCFKGTIYGTYVHGIFDQGEIAATILNHLAEKKGVTLQQNGSRQENYQAFKEIQYDKLAEGLREALDMELIYKLLASEKRQANDKG